MFKKLKDKIKSSDEKVKFISYKKIVAIISILLIIFLIYNIFFRNNEIFALSKYGSRGSEVTQIQTKLKRWGYYTGNIDRNIWLSNTRSG